MRSIGALFKAWFSGEYTVVPWRTIALLCIALIYFLSPVDAIPDYIPVIGVIDDIAVLGFLVRSLLKDARRFKEWGTKR
jgi:uncharacterized membrane protein YkvA (DUF1232 family)